MESEPEGNIKKKLQKLVLAAGHKNCFELSDNTTTLIKKNLSSKELQFYTENRDDNSIFRGVIPKVYSILEKEKRVELENITYGMKKPMVIDIKIGTHYFTGQKESSVKGFLKSINAKVLTEYNDIIYGARKMGWKVQGCSWLNRLDRKGIHSKDNLNDFITKSKIGNEQIRSICTQLRNISNVIEKSSYGFIRSSIIIAADYNVDPIVKLIDFSNAFKFTSELEKQKSPYSKGSIKGVEAVRKIFLNNLG